MSPAGSGRAQFRDGPSGHDDRGDFRARAHQIPKPRLTQQDVESLLHHGQRLVDHPAPSVRSLEWYVEAAFIGDFGAIGAAATIGARSTASAC